MKVLSMDTSSSSATVALVDDDKILGEYTIVNDRAHSQIIMPMLDEMLNRCGYSVNDVDVFAVALGPGSFTGLRIGISAIKSLCQVLEKNIIGVSSLDCIAASFPFSNSYICPIFDARRNEVYNSVYLNGNKITDDRIIDFDELLIEMHNKEVIFAGDGIYKFADKIKSFDGELWHISPSNLSMQKASSIASIAINRAKNDDYDNLYELSPIYLRLSQAEREYNLAHGIV